MPIVNMKNFVDDQNITCKDSAIFVDQLTSRDFTLPSWLKVELGIV